MKRPRRPLPFKKIFHVDRKRVRVSSTSTSACLFWSGFYLSGCTRMFYHEKLSCRFLHIHFFRVVLQVATSVIYARFYRSLLWTSLPWTFLAFLSLGSSSELEFFPSFFFFYLDFNGFLIPSF